MAPAPPRDPRLRRAALGTALVFACNGSMLGTWVSRLPAVQDRMDATPASSAPPYWQWGSDLCCRCR